MEPLWKRRGVRVPPAVLTAPLDAVNACEDTRDDTLSFEQKDQLFESGSSVILDHDSSRLRKRRRLHPGNRLGKKSR